MNVEIADLARNIYPGYHESALVLKQYEEALATIRDTETRHGIPPIAHILGKSQADAERDARSMLQDCRAVCEEYRREVARLGKLVCKHLPKLWPTLRLVESTCWWHNTRDFDWNAAETELRMIEAAALAELVEPESPADKPNLFLTLELALSRQAFAIVKRLRDEKHGVQVEDLGDTKGCFQDEMPLLSTVRKAIKRTQKELNERPEWGVTLSVRNGRAILEKPLDK